MVPFSTECLEHIDSVRQGVPNAHPPLQRQVGKYLGKTEQR